MLASHANSNNRRYPIDARCHATRHKIERAPHRRIRRRSNVIPRCRRKCATWHLPRRESRRTPASSLRLYLSRHCASRYACTRSLCTREYPRPQRRKSFRAHSNREDFFQVKRTISSINCRLTFSNTARAKTSPHHNINHHLYWNTLDWRSTKLGSTYQNSFISCYIAEDEKKLHATVTINIWIKGENRWKIEKNQFFAFA